MAEKKPATVAELQELHRLIAQSLNQRIEADMEDGIPTDAATLGAAIKFLKDNSITADPANAVTFGTHADKTAFGFKLRTASSSYNNTGSNTYSITSTGAKRKYSLAQGNP